MPNTGNKYFNGQQGLFGAAQQADTALNAALLYLGFFNPPLAAQMQAYKEQTNGIINVPDNQIKKTTNYEFRKKYANEEAANMAYLKMVEYKNSLAAMNAHPTEDSRQFLGYLKLAEKLLDTDAGDFGKAIAENPYLANMISMLQNGPKINDEKPIEQTIKYLQNTNPVSGKQETGPLQNLNIFMAQVAGLLDREYEKQKINEHYTPEKEATYLKKLDADFSKVLENLSDLEKLVREDGTSDYDEYLNAPLDVMTGKNKQDILDRPTIQNSIANIKGQKQAILNGWGMNELGVLGSLNELKFYIDIKKVHALEEANQPGAAPEAALKYQQIEEFSRKLDALHGEAMTSSLFHPSDKLSLVDRYNELLLSGTAIDDEIIKKKINLGKAATKEAMEFGGVQPKKYEYSDNINVDRILEGERANHFNPLFNLNSSTMAYMNIISSINRENPRCFDCINDKYGEVMDYQTRSEQNHLYYVDAPRMGPPIRGFITSQSTEFKTVYSPDKKVAQKEKQASIDAVKKYHYFAGKQFLLDRNEEAEMARINNLPLKLADIEKGSVLNAMIDNPMLINYYAHVCTFDPYNESKGGAVMKQWLNERNLFDPVENFIDCGTDFLEAEFEKQQLRLNAWNDKKEKVYLAKVCEAVDKMEKSFDILKNAPLDVQYDESVLINNSLAHMTGTDSSTTMRDLRGGITSMQWVKEGIQKGWSSDDIQLLYFVGEVEGHIERMKVRYRLRAEEAAKEKNPHPKTPQEIAAEEDRKKKQEKLEEKVKYLEDFQKNNIQSFKNDLFKKPIQSPSDMLAAVSKIEGFYQRYKDYPEIGNRPETEDFDAFEGVRSACDFYIPRIKNQCIAEIRKAKAEGRDLAVSKNREFTVVRNNEEMNAALQNLKNVNFDFNAAINDENREFAEQQKSQIKNIAKTFLKKKMTNGMYKEAHPEFFKSSSPDYALTKRKTDFYLDQYVEHMMKVMKPANTTELAELLEHGGHEDILSKIREKTKSDAVKGRMEAFTQGKPERKKDDPSMQDAYLKMYNATGWMTGDLYFGIQQDLRKLDKMRAELSFELRKKYIASQIEVKITGYEKKFDHTLGRMVDDPTKPIYEFDLPQEVKVDRRKLMEMTNLQADVYGRINKYLDEKKEIIRQRGGNPDEPADVAKLGTNGKGRYLAMLDAKKAVENQNLATTEFNNNGPSMLDIEMGKEMNIIPADVDLEKEKLKFENNIRYNLLKDTIERQKKLAAVLDKELLDARKLKEGFDAVRTHREQFEEARRAYERAEEELRNARHAYDRDLIESEEIGRSILPEIRQRLTNAQNEFNDSKTKYDNIKYVENLDSDRNFEEFKRNYEESIGKSAKRCLYLMTLLHYPYKGAAYKEMKKADDLETYVNDLARFDDKRSELDEILGRFGGRAEKDDNQVYAVVIPEAKRPAFNHYREKHPEVEDKIREFNALQNRIIAEKERLGEQANPEGLEQRRQALQQKKQEMINKLTKMHETIDKGYASKIAVDLMSVEDIRQRKEPFEQIVNDIVIDGENGPMFNEHSNLYADFQNGIFEKSPFKEDYQKGILEMCAQKNPTSEDIRRVSNDILKANILKDYADNDKMNNLIQMAGILDSDINVRAEVRANKFKVATNVQPIRLPGAGPVIDQPHGVNQAEDNHVAHHAAGHGMH